MFYTNVSLADVFNWIVRRETPKVQTNSIYEENKIWEYKKKGKWILQMRMHQENRTSNEWFSNWKKREQFMVLLMFDLFN